MGKDPGGQASLGSMQRRDGKKGQNDLLEEMVLVGRQKEVSLNRKFTCVVARIRMQPAFALPTARRDAFLSRIL